MLIGDSEPPLTASRVPERFSRTGNARESEDLPAVPCPDVGYGWSEAAGDG